MTVFVSHINSGCIGINITRNQDTAVPCPYKSSGVGTRHCRVLYIIPAQPELISNNILLWRV